MYGEFKDQLLWNMETFYLLECMVSHIVTNDSWRGHNFALWKNNDDWISEAWNFDCWKKRNKGKEYFEEWSVEGQTRVACFDNHSFLIRFISRHSTASAFNALHEDEIQRRKKLQLIELKEFIKSFILELHR